MALVMDIYLFLAVEIQVLTAVVMKSSIFWDAV
jgi:hypothetical protein